MIKMLLTAVVLGSVGFAGLAMAQSKQSEAPGSDVSSAVAKLEAQCAHRRTMPPDARDACAGRVRSDTQLGYGQDGAAGNSQAAGAVAGIGGAQGGIGPGNSGQGNGIGPGSGGGQGKGRR